MRAAVKSIPSTLPVGVPDAQSILWRDAQQGKSGSAGPTARACNTIRAGNIGRSIQREAGVMNDTATQANQTAMRAPIATGQRTDVAEKFPGILSLEDYEEPARRYLPRPIFGYISGAVETNASLAGNRSAFAEYDFLPRVLVNTRARNQKTTLFGPTYDLPFGFPPMRRTSLAAYAAV